MTHPEGRAVDSLFALTQEPLHLVAAVSERSGLCFRRAIFGQIMSLENGAPQLPQNLASSRFSAWQLVHSICRSPLADGRECNNGEGEGNTACPGVFELTQWAINPACTALTL